MAVYSEDSQRNIVFDYFKEISSIPRATGNMSLITEYIENFANTHGLKYYKDSIGNIVIKKDATYGYENHDTVIMQCHLDMATVNSYELEGKFDFNKDPIRLVSMDDCITAHGTSLGADNGIGIAYILSVLSDNSLDHPPIEALFTVDALNNMRGALDLDYSMLQGKRIINLDHHKEHEILTSCSGGRKVKCAYNVETEEYTGIKYNLVVCGLTGGHPALEIDKGRANANILAGRFVQYIASRADIRLGYLKGGLIYSAIPREAKAEIYVKENDIELVEKLISDFTDNIEKEYGDIEENLTLYGQNMGEATALVLDKESFNKVLLVLNDIPDGIIKISRNGDDLVQTSLNCGIMRLDRHHFELFISIRSMVDTEKEALSDKIAFLTKYLKGTYEIEYDYPAWEYNHKSDFRDLAFDIYQRCYERNPRMTGSHFGIECGAFYKNINDIDIIAIGPNITAVGTTKESLSISSAERTYEYIIEILANC